MGRQLGWVGLFSGPLPEGIQRAGGYGVDVVEGSQGFCWLCVCKCVCECVQVHMCMCVCT